MDSLGPDVVYVSGRKRPPGEMNGKSGNLNNVAAQLYPKGMFVPGTELIAVFDADQARSVCPGQAVSPEQRRCPQPAHLARICRV